MKKKCLYAFISFNVKVTFLNVSDHDIFEKVDITHLPCMLPGDILLLKVLFKVKFPPVSNPPETPFTDAIPMIPIIIPAVQSERQFY